MKKTTIILIVVAMIAIVILAVATLNPMIGAESQLDSEVLSTTNPVLINDNDQQAALQKIATANYKEMETDMNKLKDWFKVSDFCPNLVIFQETTHGETYTLLKSETGFYVGPILLVDANGKTVYSRDVVCVSYHAYNFIPEEYKDCEIISLNEINPTFAKTYPYF